MTTKHSTSGGRLLDVLDMRPISASYDVGNSGRVNPVSLRNIRLCFAWIVRANSYYVALRKLRHVVHRSVLWLSMNPSRHVRPPPITAHHSSLFCGVSHVVLVRSKEKVMRIRACGVALVAYLHSFWNWPKVKNPACTVSVNFFTACSVFLKESISVPMFRAGPVPAVFNDGPLGNLRPKATLKCRRETLRSQKLWSNFELFVHSVKRLTDHASGEANLAGASSFL